MSSYNEVSFEAVESFGCCRKKKQETDKIIDTSIVQIMTNDIAQFIELPTTPQHIKKGGKK